MIRFILSFVLLLCHLCVWSQFEKKWQGTLSVNGTNLDMTLDIQKPTETYIVLLDIKQQNANGLKASNVTLEGDEIIIEWSQLGFGIVGSINKDGNFDAMFVQGAFSENILFTPAVHEVAMNRPQMPKPKFAYPIENVSFTNLEEGNKLYGTLTLPSAHSKSTPIAVMISGSGQQDRDETIFGHKPFWVIADYFARNGIGVLRYDDRGAGESELGKDFQKATTANFAKDAVGAIAFLRQRGYKNIGIIGHSEGGMIAPMIASQDSKMKFIVLLAGPGVNGGDVIIGQSYVGLDTVNNKEGASFNLGLVKTAITGIRADRSIVSIEGELDAYIQSSAIGKQLDVDNRKAMIQTVIQQLKHPWMNYFIKFDPAPYLQKVKCPVLALNGSRDFQILPQENLNGIRNALQKGGNKKFEIKEMKDLNHLFQPAVTGLAEEYENIETTFDPATMQLMKDWILGLKD